MAEIKNSNPRPKSKRSCFSSCFGFSSDPDKKKLPKVVIGSGRVKKSRWFPWSRFRIKKPGTKTVPVDNSSANVDKKIKAVESEKVTRKHQIPANIACKPGRIPGVVAVVSDQGVTEKVPKAKYGSAQPAIVESRNELHPLGFMKDDAHRKQLFVNRKIELTKTGSQPGTPKKTSCQTSMISHSSSFPPRGHPKSAHSVRHSRFMGRKAGRENDTHAGKFHPILGMSILIVILAIILLWGRICAIFCTSVWFYFIPYLKNVVKSSDNGIAENRSNSGNPNLESEEYKKKVILEGLLGRNRRSCTVIL